MLQNINILKSQSLSSKSLSIFIVIFIIYYTFQRLLDSRPHWELIIISILFFYWSVMNARYFRSMMRT